MKYIYPAIFKKDLKEGGYLVTFPDIEGCITEGNTLEEAYEMAEDALNAILWDMEESKQNIPEPSCLENIQHSSDSIVSLVKADTLEYRKQWDDKAVKKTLSIPQWLNTKAIESNLNFSSILQKALIKELNL